MGWDGEGRGGESRAAAAAITREKSEWRAAVAVAGSGRVEEIAIGI